MTASSLHSRPDKLTHAETVLYEIDMLRHAKNCIARSRTEADQWLFLEAFLLHYRNLVEFFSGKVRFHTDLSISRSQDIWPSHRPNQKNLDRMTRPDLYEKYDTPKNPEAISKYLQHCTHQRIIKKKWNVKAMYEDLEAVP